MGMRRWLIATVALAACGNSYTLQDAPDAGGTSAANDAGVDATAPAVPAPAGCDANADGRDSPACATDDFAVFVDANAPPGGVGTKASPRAKINDALSQAQLTGKQRIYICGTATYAEHVDVTIPIRLIGGFACGTWTAVTGSTAKIAPSDAGFALHIEAVGGHVQVEDMAFASVAGTSDSSSSIAVFAAASNDVVFERVTMTASDGFAGLNGTPGVVGVSEPTDLSGNAPASINGGVQKVCNCSTGGASTGGRGGNAAGASVDGQAGLPVVSPPVPGTATGVGQTQIACNGFGGSAANGSNAPQAADASPVSKVGVLTISGWAPGDGASGINGGPGQGGGGGGSHSGSSGGPSGGGGGGACGGCGGSGGGGGDGGGGSIALLVFQSTIKLSASTLVAGTGGKGGNGDVGAIGTAGGNGASAPEGCTGGKGGTGGGGGTGAGGAGGVSVGILYSGTPPTSDSTTTVTAGTAGQGGRGGTAGTNDGPQGLAASSAAAP